MFKAMQNILQQDVLMIQRAYIHEQKYSYMQSNTQLTNKKRLVDVVFSEHIQYLSANRYVRTCAHRHWQYHHSFIYHHKLFVTDTLENLIDRFKPSA